jgi:biopolymer transport protein ExbD
LSFGGASDAGDAARPPAVPSSELVKAGAVWDPPPAPLVISLAADGTISLLGHEVGLDELVSNLRDATRDPSHREPDGCSNIDVVLRVAPALPWAVVEWVMQACGDVNVSMDRVHFAVMPEAGGAAGVIPTFLTKNRGGASLVVFAPEPIVRATLVASEGVANRGAVFAALKAALAAATYKVVEIATPFPRLPRVGHVLSVLDLALRAGADRIDFTGAPSPWPARRAAAGADMPGEPGSVAWLRAWVTAHAKGDPIGLAVRVGGTSIDATSPSSALPAAPPRRARSGRTPTRGRVPVRPSCSPKSRTWCSVSVTGVAPRRASHRTSGPVRRSSVRLRGSRRTKPRTAAGRRRHSAGGATARTPERSNPTAPATRRTTSA